MRLANSLDIVEPGLPVWNFVEAIRFPYGADGFRWLVNAICIPTFGIHLVESWWMDRTRLAPRAMARGSLSWCLWIGTSFLTGFPTFFQFDRIVKARRSKALDEDKKH